METPAEPAGAKPTKLSKNARLSMDGKLRRFPQDSYILQYLGTGMLYGRVKVRGKLIRRKLDTDVYTTAKPKLLDFLKEQKGAEDSKGVKIPTFGEATPYSQSIPPDRPPRRPLRHYFGTPVLR